MLPWSVEAGGTRTVRERCTQHGLMNYSTTDDVLNSGCTRFILALQVCNWLTALAWRHDGEYSHSWGTNVIVAQPTRSVNTEYCPNNLLVHPILGFIIRRTEVMPFSIGIDRFFCWSFHNVAGGNSPTPEQFLMSGQDWDGWKEPENLPAKCLQTTKRMWTLKSLPTESTPMDVQHRVLPICSLFLVP